MRAGGLASSQSAIDCLAQQLLVLVQAWVWEDVTIRLISGVHDPHDLHPMLATACVQKIALLDVLWTDRLVTEEVAAQMEKAGHGVPNCQNREVFRRLRTVDLLGGGCLLGHCRRLMLHRTIEEGPTKLSFVVGLDQVEAPCVTNR